jgi:hypothetical protein
LPGHATTITPSPFPTTPSAPPDPSTHHASGSLRGRLDRTRRGMPPLDVPDDAPLPTEATPLENLGSEHTHPANHPERDRISDRPPRPGSVDDLRGFAVSPGSGGDEDAFGAEATAEPVDDETAADARRRARAAAVSFAPPALLPEPDSVRRKNWLPWIVIGTGLLVSWVMIKVFGSAPAGVPVGPSTELAAGAETSPAAAPEPSAAAATLTTGAPVPALALRTGGYVLEVASDPPGARITAADQVVLAPAVLELATINAPILVKAELDGLEATATVAPTDFQLKDGRHVHQLVLKLPATASSAPGATAEVEQTVGTEPSASRDAPDRAERPNKPSARAAKGSSERPASRRSASPEPKPATPLIAAPPVPIDDAAPPPAAESAPSEPAESSSPVAAITDRSVLETALECLSRGDNLCVVSALEGRARTARELEVLIETHLALGNSADAERSMRRYLERFTEGKSAAKYQRWLERRGEAAASPAP